MVQEYVQKEGIDFYIDDLFAPVTRLMTVWLLLSYAATKDWEIHQIDVKSAYLYRELNKDEIIYVKPPPGNLLDDIKPGQVLRLKKALYRLKQAGRCWYKKIMEILTKIGLTWSNYDNTVFYMKHNNKISLITFMHIDDITILAENEQLIKLFKNQKNQIIQKWIF